MFLSKKIKTIFRRRWLKRSKIIWCCRWWSLSLKKQKGTQITQTLAKLFHLSRCFVTDNGWTTAMHITNFTMFSPFQFSIWLIQYWVGYRLWYACSSHRALCRVAKKTLVITWIPPCTWTLLTTHWVIIFIALPAWVHCPSLSSQQPCPHQAKMQGVDPKADLVLPAGEGVVGRGVLAEYWSIANFIVSKPRALIRYNLCLCGWEKPRDRWSGPGRDTATLTDHWPYRSTCNRSTSTYIYNRFVFCSFSLGHSVEASCIWRLLRVQSNPITLWCKLQNRPKYLRTVRTSFMTFYYRISHFRKSNCFISFNFILSNKSKKAQFNPMNHGFLDRQLASAQILLYLYRGLERSRKSISHYPKNILYNWHRKKNRWSWTQIQVMPNARNQEHTSIESTLPQFHSSSQNMKCMF